MKALKQVLLCSLTSLTLASPASQAEESKGWDRTVRVADYLEPARFRIQPSSRPRSTSWASSRRRPDASRTS